MGKRKKEAEKDQSTQEDGGEEPSKKIKLSEDHEEDESGESKSKDQELKEEVEKMQLLVSAFSNSQQDQFEIYRRSRFPKAGIRRIMQGISGGNIANNAVIAMAGITKVYVGEIVEVACQSREELNDEGPLQPKHIREAVRRLRKKNKIPNSRYKKVFPFR